MGAPEFRFDPANHTYWLGGVQIDGVTSMLKDMEDLSSIPPAVLARKAALGTAVHYATELDDQGILDEDTVHEEVRGYLEGWRLFKREHNVEFIAIEQRLVHLRMRYAGTVDRVMKVDGERGIWDIKNRVEIPPVVGIQLAAYHELVRENGIVDRRHKLANRAIQLKPDGTYQIHRFNHEEHYAAWIALLTIRNWRHNHERT